MSHIVNDKQELMHVQRAINEMSGANLKPDGAFGPKSVTALCEFQRVMGLPQNGVIDAVTYAPLKAFIDVRYVTNADIVRTARELGIQPSMLMAIASKESVGSGFLADGRCVLLYERHKFFQFVRSRISYSQAVAWRDKHPDLCHSVWDASYYKGGSGEWTRLSRALLLDATCALLSCSWGMYQIMGFNYNVCGWKDVQSFVEDMSASEKNHLKALNGFISNNKQLLNAFRTRNFQTIARIYNGVGYAKNNYDKDLMKLEARFTGFN